MDVEFMRRLHKKVNIVPVIAKADTLTKPEIQKLKTNLLNDIEDNKIKVSWGGHLRCDIGIVLFFSPQASLRAG